MSLQAVAKGQRDALHAALQGWTQAAAASAERRRLADVMAARLQHLHLCAVFVSWQQQASELQQIRQLLSRAVQGQALRAMSRATSAWRDAVHQSR